MLLSNCVLLMSINTSVTKLPILYSFRRCPYAIRARLAIKVSNVQMELREVVLSDKPKEMLDCSAKGTVPVLLLPDGEFIDESMDIMHWALAQHDPQGWLSNEIKVKQLINHLIDINDNDFKKKLDRYKYADRYPEQSIEIYRQQAEIFLHKIEIQLKQHQYLVGNNITLADMAILPFIRQFAYVDKNWFEQTPYIKTQAWLVSLLSEKLFNEVMIKYPPWKSGEQRVVF